MGRDASLDEFLDSENETLDSESEAPDSEDAESNEGDASADEQSRAEEATTEDGGTSVTEEGDSGSGAMMDEESGEGTGPADGPAVPASEADPATVTFEWSPSGASCAACGATVERRWHGEAGLVCPDCKEW